MKTIQLNLILLNLTKADKRKMLNLPSNFYSFLLLLLKNQSQTYAARYSLKRAIMSLGPQGFPFEQYLAALLRHYGYRTYTNQIFAGQCITHEIDVVAEKSKEMTYNFPKVFLPMVELDIYNHLQEKYSLAHTMLMNPYQRRAVYSCPVFGHY